MPFPYDKYPWLNFQELNLAYFIKHFREIFQQWDELYHDLTEWKETTDQDLADWKTATEAGLESWKTGLTASLETWKAQTASDISGWETATLAALEAWKTATTAVFEQIRVEAAGSASAAAASASQADIARAAAVSAQSAAEQAAAEISAELAQIQTNTADIADLKSALTFLDSITNDLISLTWVAGGIKLTDGTYTDDGSTTRSRVESFLDTTKLSIIHNASTATLWMVFYTTDSTSGFVNAVNVNAGGTFYFTQNHAKYMRLDFRSSTSEADKVFLYASTANSKTDDNHYAISRINNAMDSVDVPMSSFMKGNASISGTSITYANYSKRVCTRQGVTIPLDNGDVVYLSDYSDAKLLVLWEKNGLYYGENSWVTSGQYTVKTQANYIFIIGNKTEVDLTSIEPLASLLMIKRNILTDYVSTLKQKAFAGIKPLNLTANAYLTETKPLVLMHFSDIHGDIVETDRINSVYGPLVEMCDDVICTGDMVASRFSDDASFITDKGYLLVIGNHDALTDPSGQDWTQMATQEQLYDKFFAPDIANWGVTYTEDLTYYYKDYPNSGIRLIVLNNFMPAAEFDVQKEWLSSVLDDAKENDLSVIIAMHYHPKNAQKISCNFTRIDKDPMAQSAGGSLEYRVAQFISAGGKFICYLVGHEHTDYILNSSDYPNQIAICIDASSVSQCNIYSELDRKYGNHTQDLMNLTIFDTSTQTIKIIRVGCDSDNYLRSRKMMSIRYDSREIIAQE